MHGNDGPLNCGMGKARKKTRRSGADIDCSAQHQENHYLAQAIESDLLATSAIFTQIRDAVPKSLPGEIREEAIARMALAWTEGNLRPRDIPARVDEFIRKHFRAFSKYGPMSLDAKLFDDGTVTLGDTITRGFWDPEGEGVPDGDGFLSKSGAASPWA